MVLINFVRYWIRRNKLIKAAGYIMHLPRHSVLDTKPFWIRSRINLFAPASEAVLVVAWPLASVHAAPSQLATGIAAWLVVVALRSSPVCYHSAFLRNVVVYFRRCYDAVTSPAAKNLPLFESRSQASHYNTPALANNKLKQTMQGLIHTWALL